jgi:hypothetical protein
MPMRWESAALACLSTIAAVGCSTVPDKPSASFEDKAAHCEQLFRTLDTAVDRAGVRDGGSARIDGFPYLRANRFLASYRDEPMTRRQELWWIDRLKGLDVQARTIELANLPEQDRDGLDSSLLSTDDPTVDLIHCADELARRDLSESEAIAGLRAAVDVPDEYHDWKRVLGLYPLSAVPFLQGVSAYHADMEAVFATPLEDLPINGRLVRYEPPPAPAVDRDDLSALLTRARQNPLKVPLPAPSELSRLFATFAPVLEIDQVDRSDRIGTPLLSEGGKPGVDTSNPVVFVRPAHTRYAGETFLQLVYSVWFPERPRASAIDLLAGRLDGITWRVTLDSRGEPLLFDSIHNCGCYHMFFPTQRLRSRALGQTFQEPILVPYTLGSWRPGTRTILRIASRTHYIQSVRYSGQTEAMARERYSFVADDKLRSLPREDNSRYSLFRPNGIVPGTQRAERFVFWPMGVPDPGAMRQWGRHATAFVGKRHFDDPKLIERYFEMF